MSSTRSHSPSARSLRGSSPNDDNNNINSLKHSAVKGSINVYNSKTGSPVLSSRLSANGIISQLPNIRSNGINLASDESITLEEEEVSSIGAGSASESLSTRSHSPAIVPLTSTTSSATSSPASSLFRKTIHSPAQLNMPLSDAKHSDEEKEVEEDMADEKEDPRYFRGHGNCPEIAKLMINCDDVEIERHQPDRHRSPLLALLKRLFTCSPYFAKFFSAIFYAIASFFIVVINKIVLTNYQ